MHTSSHLVRLVRLTGLSTCTAMPKVDSPNRRGWQSFIQGGILLCTCSSPLIMGPVNISQIRLNPLTMLPPCPFRRALWRAHFTWLTDLIRHSVHWMTLAVIPIDAQCLSAPFTVHTLPGLLSSTYAPSTGRPKIRRHVGHDIHYVTSSTPIHCVAKQTSIQQKIPSFSRKNSSWYQHHLAVD